MNNYYFVARSPTGVTFKGCLLVSGVEELNKILLEHNYKLIKYHIKKEVSYPISLTSVTKRNLITFLDKLYMTLSAGITIDNAIKIVNHTTSKKMLRDALNQISKEMTKGRLLSVIMKDYSKIFPEYLRTMVYLGEISGNIKNSIKHVLDTYNSEEKIKKKVYSSMFYPCILMVFSVVVLVVIATVVIPSFVSIFKEMKVNLPLITVIMIEFSNFIVNYGWLLLIILILLLISITLFFLSKKGKYHFHKFLTKIPFIKTIVNNKIYIKFFQALSILLDSGVPVVSGIQSASHLINNLYIENKLDFAIDEIKRGETIAKSLYSINFFPSLVIETLGIAEKSGNMSVSLKNLTSIYEENIEEKLSKMATLIEPLFILLISFIVVLLIIAIFIPLTEILNNIGV